MGFLGKIFEKKECAICGGEIGLLGNRKREDGNMCKQCAQKLSPWFSDRKNSTVAEIEEQLAYREENRKEVEAFHTTCTYGRNYKVLIDEDAGKFMVTRASNLQEANPDVIAFSQVTGCDLDITENRSEETREDKDGNSISYNPPRYCYSYDFDMIIRVNHPYFDTIRFRLNAGDVEINHGKALIGNPNLRVEQEYKEYEEMGREIKEILLSARKQAREQRQAEASAQAAPKIKRQCPFCGAATVPDPNGCCEYCGAAL